MQGILFYEYIPVDELNKEVYPESCKTITMDFFVRKFLAIVFAKRSILDI